MYTVLGPVKVPTVSRSWETILSTYNSRFAGVVIVPRPEALTVI
jgi:hypothetical protein